MGGSIFENQNFWSYIESTRFMDYEYYQIPVTNGGCAVP